MLVDDMEELLDVVTVGVHDDDDDEFPEEPAMQLLDAAVVESAAVVDGNEEYPPLLDCASAIERFFSSFTCVANNFSSFSQSEGDQHDISPKLSPYSQLIFVIVFMRYARRDFNFFFFMMRTLRTAV